MVTLKKTTHVFKLFQKHRQPKKGQQVDSVEGFDNETHNSQEILFDASATSPQKSRTTASGKRGKIRRYFNIGRKAKSKNKSDDDDEHNETFMTADTEETDKKEETNLDFFSDLRVIHSTDVSGTEIESGCGSPFVESWKDFAFEGEKAPEVIEEGIEASVVPPTSPCSGAMQRIQSRARSRSLPKAVDFESGEDEDFGLPLPPPTTVHSTDFGGFEENFTPSFPSFEVSTDIPGFLSPDQESQLGTPARASKPCKHQGNATASTPKSLASSKKDDDWSQCPSATESAKGHGIVITRSTSDLSTLDGSPYAGEEKKEDEAYNVPHLDKPNDSVKEEDRKVSLEPSIETYMASPAFGSQSVASGSGSLSKTIGFPLASCKDSELLDCDFSLPDEDDSDSVKLVKLLRMPPPPPPPLPPTSSERRLPSTQNKARNSEAVDDLNKMADLCASSVSTSESSESAKTENDLLHHYKKEVSPYSWSAIKSGAVQPYDELRGSPSTLDKVEDSASISEQVHRAPSASKKLALVEKLELSDIDEEDEEYDEEGFIESKADKEGISRVQMTRNRSAKRSLLSSHGSQLDVIPEHTDSDDVNVKTTVETVMASESDSTSDVDSSYIGAVDESSQIGMGPARDVYRRLTERHAEQDISSAKSASSSEQLHHLEENCKISGHAAVPQKPTERHITEIKETKPVVTKAEVPPKITTEGYHAFAELKSPPQTVRFADLEGATTPLENYVVYDPNISDAEEEEESRLTFDSYYEGLKRSKSSNRKKSTNRRRHDAGDDKASFAKIPGLSFLNVEALDRLAANLDCSFFSGRAEGPDYEIEIDFDEESILTYDDDESTYKSFDSRDFGRRFGIEDEVEEAIDWAERHMLCGNNR